jgi:hypothetical protein
MAWEGWSRNLLRRNQNQSNLIVNDAKKTAELFAFGVVFNLRIDKN